MSTETLDAERRTFRGETIEELLPQIRSELGDDAVVLSRREGLTGGVGGFFQKRCVEVEARAGAPRVDVYDEQPLDEPWDDEPVADAPEPVAPPAADPPLVRNDAATREGLATDGVRKLIDQAQPFAALLDELAPGAGPAVPAPPAPPAVAAPTSKLQSGTEFDPNRSFDGDAPVARRAATLRERLVGAGVGEDIATEVVDAAVASRLPFGTPGRLRTFVRDELAARLAVAPAAATGPRALALVGPAGSGKTAAVAALAAAHAAAGAEVVALTLAPADGGAALRAHLDGTGVDPVVLDRAAPDPKLAERLARAFVVVDTPPAWAGSPDLDKLARRLRKLGVTEVHLALRADSGRHAASELVDGLARLRPDRLLPTGTAATAHLGGVADAALRHGLPLAYVADGPGALAPADARALAARIVA